MKERGLRLLEKAKKTYTAAAAHCIKVWAYLKKWTLVIWGYLKKAAQWLSNRFQRLTAKKQRQK